MINTAKVEVLFNSLRSFPEVKHRVYLKGKDLDFSSRDETRFEALLNKCENDVGIARIITARQSHSVDVVKVTPDTSNLVDGDALMTNESGIGLLIRHADCQAAILFDPTNRAIANVHSGWRGSVGNIYRATIESMQREYGTNPADLYVCIGPSLGPNSAEFVNYREEFPEQFWKYQVCPYYFDFWEISKMQLTNCGVSKENIEVMEIDTFANVNECYSYRRDKTLSRHGTLVALTYTTN